MTKGSEGRDGKGPAARTDQGPRRHRGHWRNALTNAGQSIRTVVASLPDATAQGEVRYVKVIRGCRAWSRCAPTAAGPEDRGAPVRPATSEYKAFSTRSVYVGGVKR